MTALRRILLAELTPRVPQAPVSATWNPLDKQADIGLDTGNLRAFKNTAHATDWACVRADRSNAAGSHYWETTVQYTGAGNWAVGVAKSNEALNLEPGTLIPADPYRSIGISKNGDVKADGVVHMNVGAIANGSNIRHWLDLDAGAYRISINGGAWILLVHSTGQNLLLRGTAGTILPHFPFTGITRPFGTTAFVTINTGASAFVYGVPDGVVAGFFTTPDPVATTFYVASEGFNTSDKDTPASTHYTGRIAADQDVELEREGSCWVWGGQTISRPGQLVLVNADGGLDAWRDFIWRDAQVALYSGYEGDERDAFTLWSTGLVDSIVFTRARRILLSLLDPLALLDRAIQAVLYPDDAANASIVGRPLPIVIGQPFNCEPVRLSSSDAVRHYQVHDGLAVAGYTAVLDSIAQAYDKGDLFLGPDDAYTAHNPITTATTGATGGGAFTTWANDAGGVSMPFNWVRITAFGAANDRFVNNGNALRCQSSGQQVTAIYHSSAVQAGRQYTIAFTASALTKAGTLTFRLDGAAEGMLDYPYTISSTGAKTVTIFTTEAANLQIVLGATELDVTIDNLTVSSVQIIDWTYWLSSGTRNGLTLANKPDGKVTVNPVGPRRVPGAVVERLALVIPYILARARLQNPAVPASPSTAALVATGDYRVADYLTAPRTFLQLLRAVLDGWCGWLTIDRSGAYALGQVAEPSQVATLTLDDTNVAGEIEIVPDLAKGLSLRIAGGKNHSTHTDADIADSVPESLRARLKAEYTVIRTGAPSLTSGVVSAAYDQALSAPAKATLLQEDEDVQAAANRVATLWRPPRSFYLVPAVLSASQADALEPGQTVRLVWPRYGLQGGRNLLVVGVRSRFFRRLVNLKLWG